MARTVSSFGQGLKLQKPKAQLIKDFNKLSVKHTLECRVASKRIKKGEPMVKRILSLTETPSGLVDKHIVGRVYFGHWRTTRNELAVQHNGGGPNVDDDDDE